VLLRRFRDRREAGRELGARLASLHLPPHERPLILALPRGGVPVGYEVARALGAPLDVLVVRKVGAPGNPELGMGAVAEDGTRVFDEELLGLLQVGPDELERAVARAEGELHERLARYRRGRPAADLTGRTVIVVDDGLATGGTARAAGRCLRARHPGRLILAVPVGAPQTIRSLEQEYDTVVALRQPDAFMAVGAWYEDFGQTTDAEVTALLETAHAAIAGTSTPEAAPASDPPRREEVRISTSGGDHVVGDLLVPEDAGGMVVFAHGSGSSRHSPRNRQVAAALNDAGLATLLMDLLTPTEERHRANVFDIALLAERLRDATGWVRDQPGLRHLDVGFFGASTGAGAALWAAADLPDEVHAVVSRGGRPDLAAPRLAEVRAPTLLIVGGLDDVVIELNRRAREQLRCESALEIVPGATHLFEEPGGLEAVERLAAAWFGRHLAAPA
jgi:putative phosphoribosyl transferase